jgi:hypothetical protein
VPRPLTEHQRLEQEQTELPAQVIAPPGRAGCAAGREPGPTGAARVANPAATETAGGRWGAASGDHGRAV